MLLKILFLYEFCKMLGGYIAFAKIVVHLMVVDE